MTANPKLEPGWLIKNVRRAASTLEVWSTDPLNRLSPQYGDARPSAEGTDGPGTPQSKIGTHASETENID